MNLIFEQNQFLVDVSLLITFVQGKGWYLSEGGAWRSDVEEEIYRQQGKSQTKHSRHSARLAWDFNLFDENFKPASDDKYHVIGEFWKSLNPKNVWGGDWKTLDDPYHVERRI